MIRPYEFRFYFASLRIRVLIEIICLYLKTISTNIIVIATDYIFAKFLNKPFYFPPHNFCLTIRQLFHSQNLSLLRLSDSTVLAM